MIPTLILLAALPAAPKLYVANSAGNDLHVIDTATNSVIKRVEVGPEPHGLVATADGKQLFLTIENTKGERWRIAVVRPGRRPRDAANDGRPAPQSTRLHARWQDRLCSVRRRLVVGHRYRERQSLQADPTGGRPHNTLCSTDGKRMYLGPKGSYHVLIADAVDTQADRRDPHFGCAAADRAFAGREAALCQRRYAHRLRDRRRSEAQSDPPRRG